MKEILRYESDDGKQFDSKAKCELHERRLKIEHLFADVDRGFLSSDEVVNIIVDNWQLICEYICDTTLAY